MKRKSLLFLFFLLLVALLTIPSMADAAPTEYCFAPSDFVEESAALDGIFLAQVPEARIGALYLGERILRAGDVVPAEYLSSLVLRPAGQEVQDAQLVFCAISEGHVEDAVNLKVSLARPKNLPPVAENSCLETYKNISNSAALKVADPENEAMTYTLVKAPKRGSVELHEDGTFTYTPSKNKVGKDSFTYTATDENGNVSNKATVDVEIIKPTDRMTYSDMQGNAREFYAVWMKEEGLFTGETVAGHICFSPDKGITRGEFLVMAMKVLGAKPSDTVLTSGFADEKDAPGWMQPYIVAAQKNGMVSGAVSESGLVFRPNTTLTKAEAAVMLQNILRLPNGEESTVWKNETALPAWAESSVSALACAGIYLHPTTSSEPLSRLDAAQILYQVSHLTEKDVSVSFPWQ